MIDEEENKRRSREYVRRRRPEILSARRAGALVKLGGHSKSSAAPDDALQEIADALNLGEGATLENILEEILRLKSSEQSAAEEANAARVALSESHDRRSTLARLGGGGGTASGLSERELELCRTNGVDPEKYAEMKQEVRAKSGGNR